MSKALRMIRQALADFERGRESTGYRKRYEAKVMLSTGWNSTHVIQSKDYDLRGRPGLTPAQAEDAAWQWAQHMEEQYAHGGHIKTVSLNGNVFYRHEPKRSKGVYR